MNDSDEPEPSRPIYGYSYQPPTDFPTPPRLHWALVLLFSILTFGLFMLIWVLVQSNWARKIDSMSNATFPLIAYIVLFVLSQVLSGTSGQGLRALGLLLLLVAYVFLYVGIYSIRGSMLKHYNRAEPMPLKMSAAWTFLFGPFYLQHHMTRIADWKASRALAS